MIPPVVQPGDEFQRIRMPNAAGASGKSLRIVSVSGNLAQFEWVDGVAMEDLQAALVPGEGIIIDGVPGTGVDPFSTLLAEGDGIDVSYNSGTRVWTITATGGGGGGGGGANLSVSTTSTTVVVASDSGTDATLTAATGSAAGVMTAAMFTKLDGIATGATANSSDATLLARANHTGTQAWSTITSTPTTLSGYGITDAITSAAVASGYQPLDSDLTAIAALTTTSFGRSLLTQADAAAARTTLGAGTSSFDGAYASLSGIPSTFTPASHNHSGSEITSGTVDPARLGSGTSISTKFLRGDSTWQTISGGGDALTSGNLSQFAATTSAQLAGVISDETGTGALVFANTPTLVTPILGTPTSGTLTNCTGYVYSNLSGVPSTFAPSAHNHAASEITSGTLDISRIPTGSTASTVCIGNDSRLSDSRTPTSHVHGNITNAGAIGSTANLPVITTTSGVLTTGSFGSSASTFCEGNDSRLSDSRTPTTHATSHQSGGGDAIKLDDLATPDDNTDLDATTTRHGLLPKLGGGTTNFLRADGTWAAPAGGGGGTVLVRTNDFRLTTESGVSVSTSDRTGQSTLYLTPHLGNQIAIYDGSAWQLRSSSEISLSLTGLTSDKNYDVFAYWTGSALALELSAAWTNDTARADAIAQQDGVWCKSGTLTRRLVGTIRTTGTTTIEDSSAKRFLWNVDNRINKVLEVLETTNSWTYNGTSYRQANASTANQVDFVCGLATSIAVDVLVTAYVPNSQQAYIGLGYDSTTTIAGLASTVYNGSSPSDFLCTAKLIRTATAGRHYVAWLEKTLGSTITFTGDNGSDGRQSGITGIFQG